jgi:hypothetical protein
MSDEPFAGTAATTRVPRTVAQRRIERAIARLAHLPALVQQQAALRQQVELRVHAWRLRFRACVIKLAE